MVILKVGPPRAPNRNVLRSKPIHPTDRGMRWITRAMYELCVGPIHESELDHLCQNRRCVNPAHLEPVSRSENLRRVNYR